MPGQWHKMKADLDKTWAPHIFTSCSNGLCDWLHKWKATFSFTIPMVLREPKDNVTYYFCIINRTGFLSKSRHKIDRQTRFCWRWGINWLLWQTSRYCWCWLFTWCWKMPEVFTQEQNDLVWQPYRRKKKNFWGYDFKKFACNKR